MSDARVVYLAHPIDFADGWGQQIVDHVKQHLAVRGIGWFDPGAAFGVGHCDGDPNRLVAVVNSAAISWCNGMLAVVGNAPTLGVGMEIERALMAGMPVLVIGGDKSWSLAGYENRTWFARLPDEHNLQELVAAMDWLEIQTKTYSRDSRVQMLPVAQLSEGGDLPQRQYRDDAGLDLLVSKSVVIPPGEFVDVPNGIAIELPSHTWAMVTGRSSTLRKRGLMVQQGIIDPGYRGELFSGVWNLGTSPVEVLAGERLAQLILFSNHTAVWEPGMVTNLAASDRSTAGFGSTGT